MKLGLLTGLIAMVSMAAAEVVLVETRNSYFEFCTTKAYGWPFPWKVDYCRCEGGKTVYPTTSKLANAGAIAGSGMISSALFGGLALVLRRKR